MSSAASTCLTVCWRRSPAVSNQWVAEMFAGIVRGMGSNGDASSLIVEILRRGVASSIHTVRQRRELRAPIVPFTEHAERRHLRFVVGEPEKSMMSSESTASARFS